VVLGDLVNRGPGSLRTLQRLRALGGAATCLLGNHDLHLLAVARGVRRPHRSDTLGDILDSPHREAWLNGCASGRWPASSAAGCACTPASPRSGTPAPRWRWPPRPRRCFGPEQGAFLQVMYGNEPRRWDDTLPASTAGATSSTC
jgi:bis(5'-nucleosyl)-tetraphosphatase (symmetrical)